MKEIFKDVPGYEGLYAVSNQGFVKNLKTNRILKASTNYKGYQVVNLYTKEKQITRLVHRLVWTAFNGPIPTELQINHINEVKSDNRLVNLDLMTPKQNVIYSLSHKNFNNKSKPVVAFDSEGNFVMYFDNMTQAGKHFRSRNGNANIDAAIITKGTAYGFKWAYFNDLSPVDKLRVIALDDIKNKAVKNEK